MPQVTVSEAMRLINLLSERARAARDEAEKWERDRDALMVVLDGQDGIRRSDMARAAMVSEGRVRQIVGPSSPLRERLPESPLVAPQLRDGISEALGRSGRKFRGVDRLDVVRF